MRRLDRVSLIGVHIEVGMVLLLLMCFHDLLSLMNGLLLELRVDHRSLMSMDTLVNSIHNILILIVFSEVIFNSIVLDMYLIGKILQIVSLLVNFFMLLGKLILLIQNLCLGFL